MSLIPPCPPFLAQAAGIGYDGLMIRRLDFAAWLGGASLLLAPALSQEAHTPPPAEAQDASNPQTQAEAEAEAAAERERLSRERPRIQGLRPLRPGASAPPPPPSAAPMPAEPEPAGSGPKESFAICPGDPRCPS